MENREIYRLSTASLDTSFLRVERRREGGKGGDRTTSFFSPPSLPRLKDVTPLVLNRIELLSRG